MVFILVEHPEDLGTVVREEDRAVLRPAAIWQLDEVRRLVDENVFTVAINQCCWGTSWRKPTRLLANSRQIRKWGPSGWPQFDDEGFYTGPLKQDCGCQVIRSLAKRSNDEAFRTTGTSVYPPRLDEAIAAAIIDYCLAHHASSPKVGEKRTCMVSQVEIQDDNKKKKEENRSEKVGNSEKFEPHYLEENDPDKGKEEEEKMEEGREGGGASSWRPGSGVPMQCFYKGKHRTIHDGGGLCSPGRWPVEQRRPLKVREGLELAAVVKSQFLKWLLKKGEVEVKEAFWKLASGKHPSSPFEESMEETRREVDKALANMGKRPERRAKDRASEIAFRRLEAMAEACGDEDCSWLASMAEEGVWLGVDEELPRVEKVFELKEKWNLDFVDDALRDSVADNYKSAEESADDIERQVLEEVEKGLDCGGKRAIQREAGNSGLGGGSKRNGIVGGKSHARWKLQRGCESSHQGEGQNEVSDDRWCVGCVVASGRGG